MLSMSFSRSLTVAMLLALPIVAGCESTQNTSSSTAKTTAPAKTTEPAKKADGAAAKPADTAKKADAAPAKPAEPAKPAAAAKPAEPAKPAAAASGAGSSAGSGTGLREVPRIWSGGDDAAAGPAAPAPVQTKPAEPRPAPAPAMAVTSNVLYVPTGMRDSSVLMVEKFLPREVVAGQPFDWSIKVTNLTRNVIKGVNIFDDCVPAFTIVKSDPQFKTSTRGGVEWSLGDFKANEVKEIKVTSTVSKAGTISSCTSAVYNAELCLDTVVVSPALAIKCEAQPETLVCNPWEVKWTVTNTGTGTARNVKVTPALPAGVTIVSGGGDLMIPALAAGQSQTFSARVKADKTGSYAVKGSANADGGLTASTGDCATVVKQATLALSATGPTSKVVTGRKATFEYTVSNTSDTPADGCRLVVNLPAGAGAPTASDGGVIAGNTATWNIGTLAPKATRKVSVTVDANTAGTLSTEGRLECACTTPATANAKAEAIGIPAILVEKADDPDPIAVGQSTTYTLSITNQGFANLTNVKMECVIPGGEAFVSGSGQTAVTTAGDKITMGVIPTLAPKAKVQWKVVMKGTKAGDQRFRIIVTANEFQTPIEAVESTNVYE